MAQGLGMVAAMGGAVLLVMTLGWPRDEPAAQLVAEAPVTQAAPVVEPEPVPVEPEPVPVEPEPVPVEPEPERQPVLATAEPEPVKRSVATRQADVSAEGPTLDEAIGELADLLDDIDANCPEADDDPALSRVMGTGRDLLDLASRDGAGEHLAASVGSAAATIESFADRACAP